MKVKVQCPCGTRFEFEVEPVNGRMPVALSCPACGADATELANAVIQQQSAAPASGLRISHSHTEPPVPAPLPPPSQSALKRMSAAAALQEKRAADERLFFIFKIITVTAIVVAGIAFGLWGWYTYFARNPEVVYSLPIPVRVNSANMRVRADEFYQLIGPGQLLTIKSKHISLYDVAKQAQVWSVPLQAKAEAAADFSEPQVAVSTNDVWLAFRDRLLRLDRQTGERKEPAIRGTILKFSSDAEALMVVYTGEDGQRALARISLPDGAIQTTGLSQSFSALKPAVNAPKAPPIAANGNSDKLVNATSAIARHLNKQPQTGENADEPSAVVADDYDETPPFILAGENVVQFGAKLLERKSITHESVKPKGKSVLDDGNVTASQGLDLAQEMVNDAQRDATGGVEIEDVSRYQVTLHRWFANDAPDWAGEVIGPPAVYSLATVDLLVAGQSLTVFDKHNKKLWSGKLTYALRSLADRPPCLETRDALYFADPGGLTRFDLATGNVRWRMETVGTSALCADERGNLYLASTTATPDQITHPHQINIREKIHPLLMKLDPETGRVLWRLQSIASDCFFSGKFLYATWVTRVQSAWKFDEGPDSYYNLRLLDPSNGREIWLYNKANHQVLKTEVQKNWILLEYEDGVSVLKFFSL